MNKNRFKFRVWDKTSKRYFYLELKFGDNGYHPDFITDPVFEQCTGLKDKNGNLIYEGDIVLAKHSYKSRPGKFIVKWGQAVGYIITAGFWLFDFSPITLETARKGDDFPESSEIEIIGNVHQTKE